MTAVTNTLMTVPPLMSAYTGSSITNSTTYNLVWDASDSTVVWGQPSGRTLPVSDDGVLQLVKEKLRVALPDGAVLHLDDQGNYRVEDRHAKVIYKANRNREFNPFINASDQVARFIDYLATQGVKVQELQSIPLALFINWLVIEAAQADADPVPEGVEVVIPPRLRLAAPKPRCMVCKRFLSKARVQRGFLFCSPAHALQAA